MSLRNSLSTHMCANGLLLIPLLILEMTQWINVYYAGEYKKEKRNREKLQRGMHEGDNVKFTHVISISIHINCAQIENWVVANFHSCFRTFNFPFEVKMLMWHRLKATAAKQMLKHLKTQVFCRLYRNKSFRLRAQFLKINFIKTKLLPSFFPLSHELIFEFLMQLKLHFKAAAFSCLA